MKSKGRILNRRNETEKEIVGNLKGIKEFDKTGLLLPLVISITACFFSCFYKKKKKILLEGDSTWKSLIG